MLALIEFLLFVVNTLLTLLIWAIVIGAIASWLIAFNVINPYNPFINNVLMAINRLTEPLCRPIRRVMPDLGGIDLSPMIVIVLIIGVQRFLLPAVAQTLFSVFA